MMMYTLSNISVAPHGDYDKIGLSCLHPLSKSLKQSHLTTRLRGQPWQPLTGSVRDGIDTIILLRYGSPELLWGLHNVYQGLHNDQGTPSSLSYRVNPKDRMISAKAVNTHSRGSIS